MSRFCCKIDKNIEQKCDTSIGGIRQVYLINDCDFLFANELTIALANGTSAYLLDGMRNMTNLTQTAINGTGDSIFIESILTFTMNFNSVNLEEQLLPLTTGNFKVLIEYMNGKWRFIDNEEYNFFKMNQIIHNSGTLDTDANSYTFIYRNAGHDYGILYNEMPEINTDNSTNPIWVEEDEYCEQL